MIGAGLHLGVGHLPGGAVFRPSFVLILLIRLTSDRRVVAGDAERTAVKVVAWIIVTAVAALNSVLIVGDFRG